MTIKSPISVDSVSAREAREMIGQIQKMLWYDFANECWDPDKEWDMGTLEYISGVLSDLGLSPEFKDAPIDGVDPARVNRMSDIG
jgi:hypothetical protein